MKWRKEFIENLNSFAGSIHKEICGEILNLHYTPSIECDIINKENFYQKLEQSATREIDNGASLYGIQRDELKLYIEDKEIKTYASQGQQRTAVLSLKMAQVEVIKEQRDEYPILLLDDIMSELDASRRTYLAGKINGMQVILTCTDLAGTGIEEKTNVFLVNSGSISVEEV